MRQDLIDSNKELVFEIVAEIAVAFGENKSNYVVGKSKIKKTDAVAVREKEKIHRYGVYLTQAGENLVYKQLLRLEKVFKSKHHLDDYDAKFEAKEIMCLHILKEAFKIAKIPFKSNYDLQQKSRQRTYSIKMFGFIMFSLFFLAILVIMLVSLF